MHGTRGARALGGGPSRTRVATYRRGKDPLWKCRPLLVPWDELAEVDQERDRDSTGPSPTMLAEAGFVLQRSEDQV